jgi:type VI secretion system protein ImpM
MIEQAPGFYGKLPALGDFVQRRLPPEFVGRWDRWLKDSMLAVHKALGAAWRVSFAATPPWRFVLAPGVVSAHAWTGLLLPSCDRVGRLFPLTLALPFEGSLDLLATLERADRWFGALERLAYEALDTGLALPEFDMRLAQLGRAPLQRAGCGGDETVPLRAANGALPLACQSDARAAHPRLAQALAALHGPASVWAGGAPHTLLVLEQLPAPAQAVALLDGCWEAHGWRLDTSGAPGTADQTLPLAAGPQGD